MSPFALQSFVDKVFPHQVVDCRIFILPEMIYFVSLFGVTPTFIIEPEFMGVIKLAHFIVVTAFA